MNVIKLVLMLIVAGLAFQYWQANRPATGPSPNGFVALPRWPAAPPDKSSCSLLKTALPRLPREPTPWRINSLPAISRPSARTMCRSARQIRIPQSEFA